jgi:hypothetical protein
MRNFRPIYWLVLALLVLWSGSAGADDRNFLRKRSAPPNILFILDASGSMVGAQEHVVAMCPPDADHPTAYPCPPMDARAPLSMLPGGGDDPTSRMGIAKSVLRDFITSVTDANYALSSYPDQETPESPETPIPRKHWAYQYMGVFEDVIDEQLAANAVRDRFGLLEPNFRTC